MLRAADLFLDADVPIEAAPSKHAVAQGMFLYVYEPGGNRVEVTTGTHFIYDPDYEPVVWTAGRARPRAGVGGQDDRDVPHLRHARRQRRGHRAADPADEPDPGRCDRERRAAIRELVQNWAVWRDAGDWERFATVWHEDGVMMATWFQGPAADFIRVSREGFEHGVRILHFLGGTVVDVARHRAIAQTKMTITQRADVHEVECDVVCTGRFYDFLERRDGPLGHRPAPADLRARPARPRRSVRTALARP